MYREPAAWHDLMERLSTMVVALPPGAGRGRRRGRPALRQLGRRPRPGRLPRVRPAPRPADLRRRSTDVPDDPLRDRDGGAARAHGRGRRRRHRARPPRRRWPTPGGGSGHDRGVQGNLDAARAARRLGRDRGGRAGGARRGRRPPRPRLQPRPRRPARDDTGLLRRLVDLVHEETARTGASRRGRVTTPSAGRPPDDLRLAGLARARGRPAPTSPASAAGASRTRSSSTSSPGATGSSAARR